MDPKHVAIGLMKPGDDDDLVADHETVQRLRRPRMHFEPRSDPRNPLTGVFATRSPDRPNPLGLHPVFVRAIEGNRLRIGPIEAIDGTPVVDIKPILR